MEKAFFTVADIAERYGCGTSKAYSIIRGIRDFNGGGALPLGKVLPSELKFWEENRGGKANQREEKGI